TTMDADRKRLTRSQPFTRCVRVPNRTASSSIVVHPRFSFSSFSFNSRIQDQAIKPRRSGEGFSDLVAESPNIAPIARRQVVLFLQTIARDWPWQQHQNVIAGMLDSQPWSRSRSPRLAPRFNEQICAGDVFPAVKLEILVPAGVRPVLHSQHALCELG